MEERIRQAREDWLQKRTVFMTLKDQLSRNAQTNKEKNKIKREVNNLKKKNETEFIRAKEQTKEKITWQLSKISKYNNIDMIIKPNAEPSPLDQWLEDMVPNNVEPLTRDNTYVPVYGVVDLDQDEYAFLKLDPKLNTYPKIKGTKAKYESTLCIPNQGTQEWKKAHLRNKRNGHYKTVKFPN